MSKNTSNQNYLIYLNLHSDNPKTFSVKQGGLVVDRVVCGIADDATFVVNQGGHYRATLEGRRNVHAYVKTPIELRVASPLVLEERIRSYSVPVRYHYKEADYFKLTMLGDEYEIDQDYVWNGVILSNHKCYVAKSSVWKYLLNRKLGCKELFQKYCPELYEPFLNEIKYILSLESEIKATHLTHERFNPNAGVCCNINFKIHQFLTDESRLDFTEAHRFINAVRNHLFSSWPKFSGDVVYPIQSLEADYTDLTAQEQFELYDVKWIGQFADLRFELLNHMRQKLEG